MVSDLERHVSSPRLLTYTASTISATLQTHNQHPGSHIRPAIASQFNQGSRSVRFNWRGAMIEMHHQQQQSALQHSTYLHSPSTSSLIPAITATSTSSTGTLATTATNTPADPPATPTVVGRESAGPAPHNGGLGCGGSGDDRARDREIATTRVTGIRSASPPPMLFSTSSSTASAPTAAAAAASARPKRKRSMIACKNCNERRVRCDGALHGYVFPVPPFHTEMG